jgi:hypothetical protein
MSRLDNSKLNAPILQDKLGRSRFFLYVPVRSSNRWQLQSLKLLFNLNLHIVAFMSILTRTNIINIVQALIKFPPMELIVEPNQSISPILLRCCLNVM